jgi:hypothetical protein
MHSSALLAAACSSLIVAGAQGSTVILDQISGASLGGGPASQFFGGDFASFDCAGLDDFEVGALGQLTQVDVVLTPSATFTTFDNVTNWSVQIYSSPGAAAASLFGDVASASGLTATISALDSRFLVSLDLAGSDIDLGAGTYWIAVIPTMSFPTGGQLFVSSSSIGGANGQFANPGGGFGLPGNLDDLEFPLAYRVWAVPSPGVLAVLGLAGVAGGRRRRR